jgi:hypothetical protein
MKNFYDRFRLPALLPVLLCSIGFTSFAQNVGIGTNTPATTLEVAGAGSGAFIGGYPALLHLNTDDENRYSLVFTNKIATTVKSYGIWVSNSGNLNFTNDPANGYQTNLSLAQSGNIGIGTVSPTAKLEIQGSLKIVNGSQGTGRVLTSNDEGLATWVSPDDKPYFSNFLYGAQPFVVPTATETLLNFSMVRWNHDFNVTAGVITIQKPGLYHFDVMTDVGNVYSNAKLLQIRTYINNSVHEQTFNNLLSNDLILNAGDEVTFRLIQYTGADVTLGTFSRISGHKVY